MSTEWVIGRFKTLCCSLAPNNAATSCHPNRPMCTLVNVLSSRRKTESPKPSVFLIAASHRLEIRCGSVNLATAFYAERLPGTDGCLAFRTDLNARFLKGRIPRLLNWGAA